MAARSVSLAALLVGLLSPSVVLAANCGMVSTCPSASLPLSGTEIMYLIQNGHSVKTPVGSVTAAGTSPGGSNGQIQYNHAGAFGGFTVSGDCTINTATGAITCTKSSGSSFGTAAFQNTGASGANLPFLNGNNTWSGTNAFGTPIGVGSGGTGVGSLTTNGLLYGGATVGVTAAMTNGQLLVGQTSAAPAPETVGGDGTLSASGTLTVTKSSGTAFGTAAFDNTGTSGATVPLLNGANTWSATQVFSTPIAASSLDANLSIADIGCIIDGGGATITSGQQCRFIVDFACTINQATLLADQSGSITVDIWKVAYGSYPPTVSNSITSSDTPAISTAQKAQDSTLTGWTTAVSAGDTFIFNVKGSPTSIQQVSAQLKCTKS